MRDFLTIKNAEDVFFHKELLRARLDGINETNGEIKKNLWRLQRLLIQKRRSFFLYDCIDGILDSTRFTRVITNPTRYNYYKQTINGEIGETCVSFFIDSLCFDKENTKTIIISAMDHIVKSFEQAGINTEAYSYNKGSLIKYKNSFEKWNKAKETIPLMLLEEPEVYDSWNILLRDFIQKMRRYYEDNRVLFYITRKPVNYGTFVYALKNKVSYEHFDVSGIENPKEIIYLLIKRLSQVFGLKFNLKTKN